MQLSNRRTECDFFAVLICAHILACTFWLFPAIADPDSIHPRLLIDRPFLETHELYVGDSGVLLDTEQRLKSWRMDYEYLIETSSQHWGETPLANTRFTGGHPADVGDELGNATYSCLTDAQTACVGTFNADCAGITVDGSAAYALWTGTLNTTAAAGYTAYKMYPASAYCKDRQNDPAAKWIQSL
eukprot:SAG31_NODE_15031_length_774_cov_0.767407_2_plen_185_part_01